MNETDTASAIAGSAEYFPFLEAAVGALLGAFVAHLLMRANNRKHLTFDFHRDFSSEEMLRARAVSDRKVNGPEVGSLRDFYADSSDPSAASIFRLIGFYERLYVAMAQEEVDCKLSVQLFCQTYNYWRRSLLERGARNLGWTSIDHFFDLEGEFRRHCSEATFEKLAEQANVEHTLIKERFKKA